jgi:tRNA(His) guanylyltransferase
MKLGDRIKRYEAVSHYTATGRTPLMIRVDGRAFHTFTRSMDRPFDQNLIDAMVNAARDVAAEMQGFKAAYIQSDEVTFCVTDYDRIESQGWFDYDLMKVVSISAALMAVRFIRHLGTAKTPVFDGRAFSVPGDRPDAAAEERYVLDSGRGRHCRATRHSADLRRCKRWNWHPV